MGWIPVEFITSSTTGYSHSPPAPHFSIISVIRHTALWWNAVRTLSISLVTTKLYLTYNSTDCATALYIAPRACTVAPILSIPISIVT